MIFFLASEKKTLNDSTEIFFGATSWAPVEICLFVEMKLGGRVVKDCFSYY